MEYLDILQGLKNKKVTLSLPTHLWDSLSLSTKKTIKCKRWKTFKFYLNSQKNEICLKKINNHSGGIYIFYVCPNIIPNNHKVIMYVGEAHYTTRQNLRKRISEYYGYAPPDIRRPKISEMIEQYGDFLYCSYLELNCSNQKILQIESELINANLFPYNNKIPNKTIGKAVKAAFLQ